MRLEEIGNEVRRSRLALGMTQGQLATAVGVTRTTLNQFENGVVKDLGIRKVLALLAPLNLALRVERPPPSKATDFLRLASTSASVSFKSPLSQRELLAALLSGKVPPGKSPHIRALLEESPKAVVRGLIRQIGGGTTPGKVERNLHKLGAAVGLSAERAKWLKND
jgi:transcriptional regulator with XRE-family HTH domain